MTGKPKEGERETFDQWSERVDQEWERRNLNGFLGGILMILVCSGIVGFIFWYFLGF